MKEFSVKDHEASWLPEGNWEMVFADEFDGKELDRSTWDYRMSMMQKPWPAWTDKGVHLDGNSNCVFTLVLNEEGQPVSSQLQTGYNFMDEPVKLTNMSAKWHIHWPLGKLKQSMYLHGQGYYECRCRLQQKPGWWSAFWLQSPTIGATLDPKTSGVEIDIMESFNPGSINGHNVFTGGYGQDLRRIKVGGMEGVSTDEFHRFGLLWDETGYTYFVDGVENGKIEDFFCDYPLFILISTEVKGYRKEQHVPSPEAFEAVGDTFLVDYVRVFEKR